MPLNVDYLLNLRLPPFEHLLEDDQAILYAVSVGLGYDPSCRAQLQFVYERDLKPFSTLPLIVGHTDQLRDHPEAGITWSKVVHGAERFWNYRQLPLRRRLTSQVRITDVFDKGERGAIIILEREIRNASDCAMIAKVETTLFCRGDGGFGGPSDPPYRFRAPPQRTPDDFVDTQIPKNAAILYRLNRDRNPLHIDLDYAKESGFPRPILHGLATLGFTASAATLRWPDREIAHMEAQFSAPMFPGEILRVSFWKDSDRISFTASAPQRDAVVLKNGVLELTDLPQ